MPPDPTDPDAALLERVQRGDRAALGRLLQRHQPRVYHVCLGMVRHRDDAAELAQDVLVKLVQHIEDFRGEAKLSTWLTRVAMNACISHLRKAKLRTTVSLDLPPGSWGGASGSDSDRSGLGSRLDAADHGRAEPTPDRRVEQEEDLGRLRAALGELDPDHRAVIVLRDLEQLDYAGIAEALELPVGTVKSRLFRAREALRDKLVESTASPP
jgi:RNA polymerase sigma-70 factor (ECF subfamily)